MHLATLAWWFTGDEQYRRFLFEELSDRLDTVRVAHTLQAFDLPDFCHAFLGDHITYGTHWQLVTMLAYDATAADPRQAGFHVAILLALASAACAAANDLVFKLYTGRPRSRGRYVVVIGLIWTGVFAGFGAAGGAIAEPSLTAAWGLLSGAFSVAANVLLLESLARIDVGVAATIYRLNLAPAAILAFLLLGEDLGPGRGLGVACAAAAVFLFTPARAGASAAARAGLGLAVAASLLRAGMGLTYKAGLDAGADRYGLLALNGVLWIVGGWAYHRLRERTAPAPWREALRFGLPSGLLICGIVLFLAVALEQGDASLVLPVAQLSFLLTGLLGFLLLGEPFGRRKRAGILLGLFCVLFMVWS